MSRLMSFLSSQRRPLLPRNACAGAITAPDSSGVDYYSSSSSATARNTVATLPAVLASG